MLSEYGQVCRSDQAIYMYLYLVGYKMGVSPISNNQNI